MAGVPAGVRVSNHISLGVIAETFPLDRVQQISWPNPAEHPQQAELVDRGSSRRRGSIVGRLRRAREM